MDRHHVIPLSLFGRNHESNIIELTRSQHETVHRTLNIERTRYHYLWRAYRRKHNGKLIPDSKMLQDQFTMQREYFHNVGRLAPGVLKAHIEAIKKIATYEWSLLDKELKYFKGNKFQDYLYSYHGAWLARLQILNNRLYAPI